MSIFNSETSSQIKEIFENLNQDVTIAVFSKVEPCETCKETLAFTKELCELSEKLHFESYDLEKDFNLSKEYNIHLTPSIVLLDNQKKYHGVKFNGIPAGHEINSFIGSIMATSGHLQEIPKDISDRINNIKKRINIKVFVTLGCPHCPGAVEKAHRIAMQNPNIDAEMIESQTFYDYANTFNVSSVPKIVINDTVEFVGNQPLEVFLDSIEKA